MLILKQVYDEIDMPREKYFLYKNELMMKFVRFERNTFIIKINAEGNECNACNW